MSGAENNTFLTVIIAVELVGLMMQHLTLRDCLIVTQTCRRLREERRTIPAVSYWVLKEYKSFMKWMHLSLIQLDGNDNVLICNPQLHASFASEDDLFWRASYEFMKRLFNLLPNWVACRTRIVFIKNEHVLNSDVNEPSGDYTHYVRISWHQNIYLCSPINPSMPLFRKLDVRVTESEAIQLPQPLQRTFENLATFHRTYPTTLRLGSIELQDASIPIPDDPRIEMIRENHGIVRQ